MVLYSQSRSEIKIKKNIKIFKNILKNKFENFFDLTEIDYRKKEDLFFDNIHLNKQGHDVYSKYIYSLINEKLMN